MALTSIHPETRIESIHLNVSDLERSVSFYQNGLGFEVYARDPNSASLGTGGRAWLFLRQVSGKPRNPRETGLYHMAIRVPSRVELAKTLKHLVDAKVPMEGFADHAVSEAIYLADPDQNGIEIYRDRPRDEWMYDQGNLRMTTDPLDVQGLLAELSGHPEPWTGLAPATRLGHIHLQVADVQAAERFYRDVLGFDLTARYGPSAAFVSAGGYHHHIGFNVWAGRNAPAPPPDSVGLDYYVIRLPDQMELERVAERVKQAGLPSSETNGGLFVRDPSQNKILLTAAA